MNNEYLDIIGLGIFKALNDKRYPILVNGKISESAIPTSITNSITSILSLIPDAASSENKLADKNFVNSSIATNTATFRGTFDDLATLQATSADINDYAFYVHTDEIGNTAYDRYKHNGSTWVFEYTLNNSSFTAEQWNAINSGITTTKVGNYDAHLINYSNPHKVTKSQVGLGNVENVALSSWAGSNKITTLGTITTGVWNGSKIGNDYLANSSITIGTTAISLGSTAKSLAGIEKLQLNDANSNLVYDSTTGSWKLTGNLLVTGFISAGAKGNSSSGGGSTYTQREWAEIKIMSASEIGLLASAYSVKEAYNELNTAIETLAGKATNVTFSQTLTSGKQIGLISIDGKSTSLFAPANYAWSEVTGKPTFATVATSGSYADLSNKPTIASLMGSTAIGGTSSYLYWNGSAWATKALGSNAFTSISKVSQLTNDSGYITGITKSMVEGVLTGNITSHTHSYIPLSDKGLSNGKVPYYVEFPDSTTLVSLGYNNESTKNNDEYYFKGLCKWAIDNFAGQGTGQIILIGNAIPNSGGFCCIQLYSSSGKDADTGLPRYCSGTYISLDRKIINFGCNNYVWNWGGSFYGNAFSSSKWATARTITLTGSVTGSVSIDGSQNVSLATTTNHTHTFASLTDKPTTISGYGITDAYTKTQTDTKLSGYLPLSGGTLTGSVTMQGMNTNLIRNITYTSTSSWARGLINLQVDGVSKFSISALGDYTLGASDNGINYAYIGCNSYDGLNLRISATSLSWGDNPLLHSGNFNSYALPLSGGTMSNTNVVTNLNADLLDGYHASQVLTATSSSRDLNEISVPKILRLSDNNPNCPSDIFKYGNLLTVKESSADTAWQLIGAYSSDHLWFRRGTWYANGTGSLRTNAWKTIAFTDSNVASATKLQNSRTIWGQSFDGTGNVSGALTGVTSITASGHAKVDSLKSSYICIECDNSGNKGSHTSEINNYTSTLYLQYSTSNNCCICYGGGNVGIGTKSPSYKLHVVGTAYSSAGLITDGAISAAKTSTSSDIRLKDNIIEIGSKMALQWLLMLKPKSWTWNDKAGVKGASMGFVAQDIEGILPQMVKKQDNGYLSLDYTQLHAIEVSALQSHEKRIEELERENKILKEELNKLKLYAN